MGNFNRFGYEWSKYSNIVPLYEYQFKGWTSPLGPDAFKGKAVLDAGCGTGRNSLWPIKYGAARVVAFDVDPRTVAVARTNLAQTRNCEVHEGSIYDIPWKDEFDISFSIGVIHHLADPKKAVSELVKATRPGGTVLVWVYGKEGHTGIKNAINVMRKITSKMPLPLLNILTYPFSFIWWLYMKILPHSHPYMKMLASASLWHVHSILFDQLLPEIANYWSREEALALFDGLGVKNLRALWVNKGSWTVWAEKV